MTTTTFVDGSTTIVASWLNDVNTTTYTTVPALSTSVSTKATDSAVVHNTGNETIAGVKTFSSNIVGNLTGNATTATSATTAANGGVTSVNGNTGAVTVGTTAQIQPISASVASNALTITASALSLDFRSATLTSGTVTTVTGTPASLVVPSTATLGTVNAVQSRLVVIALNNAGTIELAVVNIAGGNDLSETGVLSTTAVSTGSTSSNVVYSTTARTSVAYRVVGYVESTQATAGTWATAPSTIQGTGGNAVEVMSSLGYGQTWQTMGGARVFGTTYYNTTGKPIVLHITGIPSDGVNTLVITVSGIAFPGNVGNNGNQCLNTVIVPVGSSYSAALASGTLSSWRELR